MLRIACQMAGPIGLKYFVDTQGYHKLYSGGGLQPPLPGSMISSFFDPMDAEPPS